MKKIQTATLVVIAIAIVAVIAIFFPQNYTSIGCVKGVTGDIVTVLDEDGHVWRFDGQGYNVNDFVELTIFDHDTADRGDDIIMDVEKL